MATQIGSITGRRVRRTRIPGINAQTPQLHVRYRLKQEDDYNDDVLAQMNAEALQQYKLGMEANSISSAGVGASKKYYKTMAAIQKAALEEQRRQGAMNAKLAAQRLAAEQKAAKKGQMLGIANLGVTAYLQNGKNKNLAAKMGLTSANETGAEPTTTSSVSNSPGWEGKAALANQTPTAPAYQTGFLQGENGNPAFLSSAGLKGGGFDGSNAWLGAAKNYMLPIAGGGVLGATLGADLGKQYVPIGGKTAKGAIGGGIIGGLSTGAMTGWNPYAMGLGAVIGGVGSLF